ncbi:MAG: 50S ribosomal protein bL37 [Acidimicrobiales bacterium]
MPVASMRQSTASAPARSPHAPLCPDLQGRRAGTHRRRRRTTMGRAARKRKARKRKGANHGKRPNS